MNWRTESEPQSRRRCWGPKTRRLNSAAMTTPRRAACVLGARKLCFGSLASQVLPLGHVRSIEVVRDYLRAEVKWLKTRLRHGL